MTKKSINIALTEQEFDALYAASQRELRHPRDQAHYLLRTLLLGTCYQSTNDKSDVTIRQDSHVAFAESTL